MKSTILLVNKLFQGFKKHYKKNKSIILKTNKNKEFLDAEIEEIKKHKWIQSEKAHIDLGFIAEFEWVCKYAKAFREEWEKTHGQIIEDKNGMCSSGNARR